MTTPTRAELGALKTAAWAAIHHATVTHQSADFRAGLAAMKATEDACEEYRAIHHPHALSLFVCADSGIGQPVSIYAVYASGTECVYDAEQDVVEEVSA